MPTLTIGDKRVTVGPEFMQLSPEQQQATVDEIAGQIGASAPINPRERAAQIRAMPADQREMPSEAAMRTPGPALDAMGTFGAAMPDGVPIVGPLMDKAAMAASAGIGSLISGDPYAKVQGEMQDMRDRGNEQHPLARMGGNFTGALAVLGPVGGTEAGATALGLRGATTGSRMLNAGLSGAGISGADTAVRGGDAYDILESMGVGGGIGALLPGIAPAVKGGIGWVGNKLSSAFDSVNNPAKEAGRRFGGALERDARAGDIMNPVDEAAARAGNVPVMNVDRGGETTRALARSVANQSPEARATIEKTASDRFAGQGSRASSFMTKLMGGDVDDLAAQDLIRDTARRVNKPAYDRAFSHPRAQAMWNPELAQLMKAPAMQQAAKSSTTRGANRAAVEGFTPIRNPFVFSNGKISMAKGVNPTLQFWDQTKRNLDSMIGKAQRAGDKTLAADLTAVKKKLVSTLDAAVPEYKNARQGAAGFFGAEDALEAGKKFANSPRSLPEARKAYAKFNQAERKLFGMGYVSSFLDTLKTRSDRTNVINGMFKNPAARESIELAVGPLKARQVEAYVRVEDLVDRLRGAMGNSTTARQLAEMGLAGTANSMYSGWSPSNFLQGAAAASAIRHGGGFVKSRIEQNVMKELGKLLTGDDPALVQRLIHNASVSPKYMKALDKIGNALAIPTRAAVPQATRPQ